MSSNTMNIVSFVWFLVGLLAGYMDEDVEPMILLMGISTMFTIASSFMEKLEK